MLTASLGFNTIGASFSDADITSELPNPEGDVSPDHYVEIGEQTFTVFNRTTSSVILTKSLNQFFSDAGADLVGEDLQNPRIVFDRGTQRWFAAATGDGEGPLAGNWVHIAFSDTADPSGQWKQVQFVPDITGLRLHTDLSLGVDADGVYLATRNLINGVQQDILIYSIPKAELFLPNPTLTNISKFDNLALSVYGSQIQFASNFEASDGTMFAFSNRDGGNLNSIQITNADTPNAVLSTPEMVMVDVGNNPDPRIFFDPMSPPVMAAPRTIDQPVFDEAGAGDVGAVDDAGGWADIVSDRIRRHDFRCPHRQHRIQSGGRFPGQWDQLVCPGCGGGPDTGLE